jgi:hypothetical protein
MKTNPINQLNAWFDALTAGDSQATNEFWSSFVHPSACDVSQTRQAFKGLKVDRHFRQMLSEGAFIVVRVDAQCGEVSWPEAHLLHTSQSNLPTWRVWGRLEQTAHRLGRPGLEVAPAPVALQSRMIATFVAAVARLLPAPYAELTTASRNKAVVSSYVHDPGALPC